MFLSVGWFLTQFLNHKVSDNSVKRAVFIVKWFVGGFAYTNFSSTKCSEVLCCFWDNVIIDFKDYPSRRHLIYRNVEKTSLSHFGFRFTHFWRETLFLSAYLEKKIRKMIENETWRSLAGRGRAYALRKSWIRNRYQ